MKISETSLKKIHSETEKMREKLEQGQNVRDVACQLYCTALPDKGEESGYLMVDYIDGIVSEYDQMVERAMQQPENWMQEQLKKMLNGKSLTEQCTMLHQLLTGTIVFHLSMGSEQDKARGQQMLRDNENCTFSDAEATTQRRDELLSQVEEALRSCNLIGMSLDTLAEEMRTKDADAQYVVAFGRKSHDQKLLMAMQAYVDAKNGLLEDIPPEATCDAITLAVCAGVDTLALAAQAESGEADESFLAFALGVISTVAAMLALFHLAALTYTVLTCALGLGVIGSAILVSILYVPLADSVAKKSYEFGSAIGAVIDVTASLLWAGLKKLGSIIKNSVKQHATRMVQQEAYVQELHEQNAVCEAPKASRPMELA